MTSDEEHLRLLSIFHYVVGGLTALFALLPVIHLVLGIFILLNPGEFQESGDFAAPFVGWLFVILASAFITLGLLIAALQFAAGRCLATSRHYLFCLVVAGFECLMMPFGTILGVFTIVVLSRESVKQMFHSSSSPPLSADISITGE